MLVRCLTKCHAKMWFPDFTNFRTQYQAARLGGCQKARSALGLTGDKTCCTSVKYWLHRIPYYHLIIRRGTICIIVFFQGSIIPSLAMQSPFISLLQCIQT